jgi:hypothetical protein
MDFYEVLDKIQLEAVEVSDDDIINQYLQRKGKVRKKGYIYKLDRDDPNNLKVKETSANQAAQSNQAAKQIANKVRGLVTK